MEILEERRKQRERIFDRGDEVRAPATKKTRDKMSNREAEGRQEKREQM